MTKYDSFIIIGLFSNYKPKTKRRDGEAHKDSKVACLALSEVVCMIINRFFLVLSVRVKVT